jgi:hypothetical protein
MLNPVTVKPLPTTLASASGLNAIVIMVVLPTPAVTELLVLTGFAALRALRGRYQWSIRNEASTVFTTR